MNNERMNQHRVYIYLCRSECLTYQLHKADTPLIYRVPLFPSVKSLRKRRKGAIQTLVFLSDWEGEGEIRNNSGHTQSYLPLQWCISSTSQRPPSTLCELLLLLWF